MAPPVFANPKYRHALDFRIATTCTDLRMRMQTTPLDVTGIKLFAAFVTVL
jgi:hypothetical protein